MIYLDHAATSWPKPPEVLKAMNSFMTDTGGNPGRSGHKLSIDAGRIVYETREAVARLFSAPDPMRVTFTYNAAYAINTALFGLLTPDDVVVTTSFEHNAVMRPLRQMERDGLEVRVVPCDPLGEINIESYRKALSDAKMVVINHVSNVIGNIAPIEELSRLAHDAGALVLVDAAQSAGAVPVDMKEMGIDLLAFTGHKAVQGPQGIGVLIIGERINTNEMEPLAYGGTGSSSDSEYQPDFLPDKFESGTLNGVGIAGLGAGVRWIESQGLSRISEHHQAITDKLIDGLREISRVTAYGPPAGAPRASLVTFNVDGHSSSEIGLILDEEFDIMCRAGLQCAPAAHKTMGTFPDGAVRFSIGPMTTSQEIDQALSAVEAIARR